MLTVNFGTNGSLPYAGNQELVKKYLKIFKENEEYDVYSIDDDLRIVKGKGIIKNNGSWNNHKNEDDSENELYFKKENEAGNPISRNIQSNKWWTASWKEAKEMQLSIALKCRVELEKIVDHLNEIEQQKQL